MLEAVFSSFNLMPLELCKHRGDVCRFFYLGPEQLDLEPQVLAVFQNTSRIVHVLAAEYAKLVHLLSQEIADDQGGVN